MKRITLRPDDIQEWMRNSWQLYASDYVGEKSLRLWINHLIEYKVEYNFKIIYQGSQMTHAIAAWESV